MNLEDELAAFEAELAQVDGGGETAEEKPRVGIVSAKPLLKDDDTKKKVTKTPVAKPKRKREEHSEGKHSSSSSSGSSGSSNSSSSGSSGSGSSGSTHFTVPLPPDHSEKEEGKEKEKEKRVKIISALPQQAEPEEIRLLETALAEDIVAVTHVPAIQAAQSVAKTAPKEKKVFLRRAAGKIWADSSLSDWPDNDNRIFLW